MEDTVAVVDTMEVEVVVVVDTVELEVVEDITEQEGGTVTTVEDHHHQEEVEEVVGTEITTVKAGELTSKEEATSATLPTVSTSSSRVRPAPTILLPTTVDPAVDMDMVQEERAPLASLTTPATLDTVDHGLEVHREIQDKLTMATTTTAETRVESSSCLLSSLYYLKFSCVLIINICCI